MNMQAIGKKIADLRKEKDMTQVELADKIGVTYQAVSGWERGNSMPDIAKLPDISQVLGVTIDALLDNAKATELVKNVLTGQDTSLSEMETLAEVAPILKPSQMVKAVEQAGGNNIFEDLDAFVEIAKYLDSDTLLSVVKTQMNAGNCKLTGNALVQLADHLDNESLKELLLSSENIDNSTITQIACHMDSQDLKEVALHCKNIDSNTISNIACHMDSQDLKEVALHCKNIDSNTISNIACHMDSQDLKEVALHCKNIDSNTISNIACHMDSQDLVEIATRLIKTHGIKILTSSGIIEHMNEEDIAEAINEAMKA